MPLQGHTAYVMTRHTANSFARQTAGGVAVGSSSAVPASPLAGYLCRVPAGHTAYDMLCILTVAHGIYYMP